MPGKLSYADFVAGLQNLGLRKGDIVHVQGDLRKLGLFECAATREGYLSFVLSGFRETVGEKGTITTCTAFDDYARFGVPFVVEESPARFGAFTEHLRTRPRAVRSIHPIVSVCALGGDAGEICGGAHYDGFGYDSPWGELHRRNAKIVTLGLDKDEGGLTFVHYVERLYGVPYQYTKIYDVPVYKSGIEIPGPFTMSVRYLDFGIVDNVTPLKRQMVADGRAKEVAIGQSSTWAADASDIVQTGFDHLRKNRYFFLEQPPRFRKGEIPFDGPTGKMTVWYDAG